MWLCRSRSKVAWPCVLAAALTSAACDPQQLVEQGGLTQRLSIATGGTGGIFYPYGGGIAKVISEQLANVEATAEVTAGTVDNVKFLSNGSADIALAVADTLDDAVAGRGVFEDFGAVPVRALAALYTGYTQVVTLADKNIDRLADLTDRVVSTGAPGSGTEIIAFRVLEAAGLDPETDIRKQSLGASQSVDALKDQQPKHDPERDRHRGEPKERVPQDPVEVLAGQELGVVLQPDEGATGL